MLAPAYSGAFRLCCIPVTWNIGAVANAIECGAMPSHSAPPTAVPERPGVPPTAVPERPAIPSAVEPPSSPRSRAERRAGVIQTMPPQPAAPSPSAKATGSRDAPKLEVVSYSDTPAQRLVFISGRKYVEGDTTEGGFRVEHIKEDSVVLSDQGERFTLR